MLAFVMPISGEKPSNELPSTPGKPPSPGKPPTGGEEPPSIWPPLEPAGPGQGLQPTHPIVIMPPTTKPLPPGGGTPPAKPTPPGGGSAGPPSDEPGWVWIYNPVTGGGKWVNVPDAVEAIREAIGGEEAQPK